MKNNDLRTLTRLALLVAIELVMKAIGLGSVPMGPLYMSFLTLPIAVGAITMGPAAGAILGGVFGAVSFYDAITGASAMTGALFQVSPVNTFILCVGMRVLMGLCVGLIFNGLKKLDKPGTWSYILSAMCAPALNTLFFMGYIVLAFYGCDYVQNLVSVKGAANPFMFVVLLVGVQGVAEFLVSGILGGIVARAVHKFLKYATRHTSGQRVRPDHKITKARTGLPNGSAVLAFLQLHAAPGTGYGRRITPLRWPRPRTGRPWAGP